MCKYLGEKVHFVNAFLLKDTVLIIATLLYIEIVALNAHLQLWLFVSTGILPHLHVYIIKGGKLLFVSCHVGIWAAGQNGRTAERQNGRTAERQNGRTAERQNGRTADAAHWQATTELM